MAETSGTPLWKKLGLKPGMRAQLLQASPGWQIADAPTGVIWLEPSESGPADLIVAFFRARGDYEAQLAALADRIRPAGMLWIAWPRKAAGHVSDLGDTVVRDAALMLDVVDVKVAALDDDWSALKLVIRVALR
jgi:hypothetical protein